MSSPAADSLASPTSSPSLSPTRARRLSARRGSVSASDPWGTHASINNNPTRATSSRLTIVRVPPTEEDPNQRRHRRHGSNASTSSTSSKGEGSRMSFAFTSFSQGSPGSNGQGGSPTSSPRLRSQSPNLSRRYSGSLPNVNKLSPDQLLDVARQSCNPRPTNSNGPATPVAPPLPVSFTPLPDTIHLPFIERPAEVSHLVVTPPSAKLFALLAQTFPEAERTPTGKESVEDLLSRSAKSWTYSDLDFWFRKVDRDVANDVLWAAKCRTCIMNKSELIWERIKGALGVPPELDVDEEELQAALESETATETAPEEALSSSLESERYPSVFDSPNSLVGARAPETVAEPDELTIEPVIAANATQTHPPTSSALDPEATHELHEVREEDEEQDTREGDSAVADEPEVPEVHGLRIVTSPASPMGPNYAVSPMGSPSSIPLGSPKSSFAIPRAYSNSTQDDAPYDALNERGPGHPLFPSSFAQLSMQPTLKNNSRFAHTQSLWNPPSPVFGNPHTIRTGVQRTASVQGRPFRPEWAAAYDPARHEFAVASSTGSVSALDV